MTLAGQLSQRKFHTQWIVLNIGYQDFVLTADSSDLFSPRANLYKKMAENLVSRAVSPILPG